jgi:hypothetical protein
MRALVYVITPQQPIVKVQRAGKINRVGRQRRRK